MLQSPLVTGEMTDQEEQAEELLVLAEIQGEEQFQHWAVEGEGGNRGRAAVAVQLGRGKLVVRGAGEEFTVAHLPPVPHCPLHCNVDIAMGFQGVEHKYLQVRLVFSLPPDYPSQSPPLFSLSCPWLAPHQLSSLEAELADQAKQLAGQVECSLVVFVD